jgi:hypothetical protein
MVSSMEAARRGKDKASSLSTESADRNSPAAQAFDKLARRPGAVRIPALALACHHRKPGEVAGA